MNEREIDQHDVDLVVDLIDQLDIDAPVLRMTLVEAARARLVQGDRPSAHDLAETVAAHFA